MITVDIKDDSTGKVIRSFATGIKHELENDDDWEKFVTLSAKTKREIFNTMLGPLVPPNQRKKARYMNVDTLLKWAEKILMFLNEDDETIAKYYDVNKVREKLSWMKEFNLKITEWNNFLKVITQTEYFIKKFGLNRSVFLKLKTELNKFSLYDRAKKFKVDVISFVSEESLKAKPGERLLGSSDIIESLFGKQKSLEKEQSKSGFYRPLISTSSIRFRNIRNGD